MSRSAIVALGMLLAATMIAPADDAYPIKVYPCPRVDDAITVDGRLTETAWERAPLVGGFTYYNKPDLVEPQTFFRVLYSSGGSYFGVTCDEPLMDKLTPITQVRDAHDIFSTEAIEFFLDLNHDHRTYFQFAVNAAGSIYDSEQKDPLWNADARAQTAMLEEEWTLEFFVPWQEVGTEPERGTVIGFNVCRDRLIGGQRQWSNWAQTKADFHDPERFAHLVLSPTPRQLGDLREQFREPDRTGPIVVFGKTGFSQQSYRALVNTAIADIERQLKQLRAASERELDENISRELNKLIEDYRGRINEVRDTVRTRERIEADQWFHVQLSLKQIAMDMEDAVWQARLKGLLMAI